MPAQSQPAPPGAGCGELVTLDTHGSTKTRYALGQPKAGGAQAGRTALVLLVGGGGHLNLDDKGCPRALKGNSLVRMAPYFQAAGLATALVDAPSDHPGEDGLKGFRLSGQHAEDIGKVVTDLRKRGNARVWLVGTSRGTISAANAAARLSGAAATDGLVLTSAITSGGSGGQRPWVVQTVFDARLEAIKVPVLVVGHAADQCIRTPPGRMTSITARTAGAREQVFAVTGGPGGSGGGGRASVDACQGNSPHGFVGQDAAVAAGIVRFVRGGSY
jgi:pimeloyl-ACP methyl ester carboxylesterase